MSIQKIITLILFTFIFLFFVGSITYFNNQPQDPWDVFEVKQVWIQKIDIWDWERTSVYNWDQPLQKEGMYVDTISSIDEVYFLWDEYNKDEQNLERSFDIGKGLYVFDIYDISYTYRIWNQYFHIQPLSPWKIFIDSRDIANTKFFALNSIFQLSLIDGNNQDPKQNVMTHLVLYPHMYFTFDMRRNGGVRNADLLRIETISKGISSFWESIFSTWDTLNPKLYDLLYGQNDPQVLEFLNTFSKLSTKQRTDIKSAMTGLSQVNGERLFGEKYIEKYFSFFLNPAKKSAYYKSNIINEFNKLYTTELSNNQLIDIQNEITTQLTYLEKANREEFWNFAPLLLLYVKAGLQQKDISFIPNILTITQSIASARHQSFITYPESSLYLSLLYDGLDNGRFPSGAIQKNLPEFLSRFLKENKLEIFSGKFVNDGNQVSIQTIDSLAYYLKILILNEFSLTDMDSFESRIEVFKTYLALNTNLNDFYQGQRAQTILVEYYDILSKLTRELGNAFFKNSRDNRGLLLLQDGKTRPSVSQMQWLDRIFESLFSFYSANQWAISQRDQTRHALYNDLNKRYKEYTLALQNYNEYVNQYDAARQTLTNENSIYDQKDAIVLSRAHLEEYLSQFYGLDISGRNFTIRENTYYDVTDVAIRGKKLSFTLEPSKNYTLSNIVLDGVPSSQSYELTTLQNTWKIRYDRAIPQERPKHDFRNFFLNTFLGENQQISISPSTPVVQPWDITDDDSDDQVTPQSQEDPTIMIFKRDRLFGARGDFQLVSSILDIKYDDVEVVRNAQQQYDIIIKKSILRTNINLSWREIPVIWLLRGKYIFSSEEHAFSDLSIVFYTQYSFAWWTDQTLFDGKVFPISGKIATNNFTALIPRRIADIYPE